MKRSEGLKEALVIWRKNTAAKSGTNRPVGMKALAFVKRREIDPLDAHATIRAYKAGYAQAQREFTEDAMTVWGHGRHYGETTCEEKTAEFLEGKRKVLKHIISTLPPMAEKDREKLFWDLHHVVDQLF